MIIAIADDLTGAAEIGGIGRRYGLKVLLSADVVAEKVDLLVVYTNTRSLSIHEATAVMQALTRKAAELKPSLFYKKTDSVLRGHVLEEMKTQMDALDLKKALLLPVNPLLGRTIQNGHYYVNGRPVHEAGFADDPEFPIKGSKVQEMLRAKEGEVTLLKTPGELNEGITVGEASSMKDVKEWASAGDGRVFYAGAASFFAALLHQRFVQKKGTVKPILSIPLLLVSGTTFHSNIAKQKAFVENLRVMPEDLFDSSGLDVKAIEGWAADIVTLLRTESKCIMAIGNGTITADPVLLRHKISAMTRSVLQQIKVKDLLIEGGSTAYAIIQELGFTRFTPTDELQQGVVRMTVDGADQLHMTIKPGSYAWPYEWERAFE